MKFKITLFILFALGLGTLYAQKTVSGTVTDSTNVPLPGVNVIIKGSGTGVVTDFDGNYTLQASEGDVLQFSFVGFANKEVTVGTADSYNVIMQTDNQVLNEVVVIGYGTSSKKELVSAVSSVKGEELENQPTVRLDQALQGRAAGVEVTSANGAPGSGTTIRIRGNSSIQGNNDPLYVVDGFIAGPGFNLNTLNVNDIKSLEVLKDATALAIYGTRGAAGVILITTKSGEGLPEGKPTISLNHYSSVQTIANEIPILKGKGYIDYVNESGQFVPGPGVDVNGVNVPIGMTDSTLPLNFDPENTTSTDWLDLITHTGVINNTDLSISGRSKSTNYYISFNYFDQEGLIKESGIERFVFRNNLDVNLSDKFKTGIRFNLSRIKKENNKVAYSQIISQVLPVRSVYGENGEFTGTDPISGNSQRNPVADLDQRIDHNVITNLTANAYFQYEILDGLRFKTTFGSEINYFKNNFYVSAFAPERLASNANGGLADIDQSESLSLLNENTFTYDRDINEDNSIKILAGFTWQKDVAESTSGTAQGFPNDVVTFNNLSLGSDPTTYELQSGYNQRTLASLLGRITYSYKQKYILTLVGRQDYSSVFEKGNKGSFFPSAGIAWNVDEEDFLNNNNSINRLKFRASYGAVGEQGVAPYNSFDLLNPQNTYFNENLVPAVIQDRPRTQDLKWETTKQLDVGVEIGLFKNRVSFEAGYYKRTTEDLLLNVALPGTASSFRQLKNIGSIENRGFEFSLNTVNIRNDNFSWQSALTLTSNKSEVLDLGDEQFIDLQSTGNQGGTSARLIVGEALPVFFGAEYLGTYKTPEEIVEDNRVGQSFLGSPRFRDVNGDGTINQQDYSILGSPQPDFYGGFRNTFTYKDLSLDIFFQGQYGNDIFNVVTQTSFYGRGDQNLDPIVLNRYIEGVNETSDIPRAGTSASSFNPNSTINVEDGSFLRLKQVSLGYDIPLENTRLGDTFKRINVYISGNNLLLFSKFTLGDPEVNNFNSGQGFNSVSQGFASGQYPYGRTFTTGVKFEF